ncbi:HEAT repeat-containing protein [Chitinophaga sp. YR573]|uniref:HEAT repeat domain-containing protein n=1 Tax=Chitinophaga sp. YR573 TaxID=1881040 RepID=UPI0008D6C219|nr:HEAT repeat domain-containing protein [Chitinophaga sp. YR573]SEW39148.1 HEAT repeat-containing protein [Chitinophaga sp. YR573]
MSFRLPDSKEPDVLLSFLQDISNNNENLSSEEITIIASLKDHENEDIREAVAQSLAGVEDEAAVNILIALTTDEDSSVRSWATFGLGNFDIPNVTNVLWDRIDDEDEETRFEAISGLAKRKDARIKGIIARELSTGEFGSLLFEAIAELGDPDFLPSLELLLAQSSEDKTIDEVWLKHLKNCIDVLKEY